MTDNDTTNLYTLVETLTEDTDNLDLALAALCDRAATALNVSSNTKAGAALRELVRDAHKVGLVTGLNRGSEAERANQQEAAAARKSATDWRDDVRQALKEFRLRTRNVEGWSIPLARRELKELANYGFDGIADAAVVYAEWDEQFPTEEAANTVLAYVEASLVTYPASPGPATVSDYLDLAR